MTYVLHEEAERDLAESMRFYEQQAGPALSGRFPDEFVHAANLLVEYPDLGIPLTRGRRIFSLRVFPYALVYRKIDIGIRVLILRHQHRRPGYGGGRI